MGSVLFDLQAFAEQRHGGVSRYFRELGTALDAQGHWRPLSTPGLHLAEVGFRAATAPRLPVPDVQRTFRIIRQVNRAATIATARRLRRTADVYHATWYHRPTIEALRGMPLVITVHDMIPEAWPGVTTKAQLDERRWAIDHSVAIACPSTSTLTELVERFPHVEPKAFVARPGLTALAAPDPSFGVPTEPYFVYVGKRGSYKDFPTCVKAVIHSGIPMVVIGGGTPERSLSEYLAASGNEGLVRFYPNLEDSALAALVSGSAGLVSSSRQEGFGIPPLEALGLGVPVILSDIPVYREIYGPWARFFPPGDASALAGIMEEILRRGAPIPARSDLEAAFDWGATAAAMGVTYDLVAG